MDGSESSSNGDKHQCKKGIGEEIERMYDLSNTSIEEYKCKELQINIAEELEPASKCRIYKVLSRLRNVSEKSYTPQLISIGPFHYRKKEYFAMEKYKMRYKKNFDECINANELDKFITFLKNHEQRIRNWYSEPTTLSNFEFVTMIFFDAFFIMELLLKHHEGHYLVHEPHIQPNIWLDLQLLENQLPYFVLEELYQLVEHNGDNNHPNLFSLSCKFFDQDPFTISFDQTIGVGHFIDLIRYALIKSYPQGESTNIVTDLPCAVKLHESGVKFRGMKEKCLLDVEFKKSERQIPFLKVDGLQISTIQIGDETESLFRNMMALEQCYYPFETLVCNYFRLMDFLIKTEKDVELLVEKGIIYSGIGDNALVAEMFN